MPSENCTLDQATGQYIANQLIEAEVAIDRAVMAIAKLGVLLPEARLKARIAAEIGQEAIDHIAASHVCLGGARREIVAAHKDLAVTARRVGLDVHAFGSLYGKPSLLRELKPAIVARAA